MKHSHDGGKTYHDHPPKDGLFSHTHDDETLSWYAEEVAKKEWRRWYEYLLEGDTSAGHPQS